MGRVIIGDNIGFTYPNGASPRQVRTGRIIKRNDNHPEIVTLENVDGVPGKFRSFDVNLMQYIQTLPA